MRSEKGFTLIELIIIIIILGILAAIAIPRYLDLSGSAKKGVAEGVLGSLRGAETLKFSNYLLNNQEYTLKDVIEAVQVEGDVTVTYTSANLGAIIVKGESYVYTYTPHGTTVPGQFTKGW